jgi:crotonobetainyl-CoA:carnitine CoA-transferase CaiB-like acyl-CoA transferase
MNREKGLLRNILVLDLADAQGSFCSRLLADLGATVVKIELPDGSLERRIGPFVRLRPGGGETSASFAYHNANKLGVVLDPETPGGKRLLRNLAKQADVLIESFPRRCLAALDLGPQRLRRVNPRLIHLSITGFGRSGPGRDRPFSDSVGSATGGQTHLSGYPAGPPVKPRGLQSCYVAALNGAVAVLLNLRRRKLTGRGACIDISIQEAVASALDHVMVDYFHNKRIAKREGRHYEGRSFSLLRCKDGYIQMTILRDWETLIELMASEGKPGDLQQPKWRQPAYRQSHFDHVLDIVESWTRGRTVDQLAELGQAMRFPWAPVASLRDVLKSPQLKARRFFFRVPLPGGSVKAPMAGPPYRFSSFSPSPPLPAPMPGEHTSRVLKEFCREQKKTRTCPRAPGTVVPEGKILKGIRIVDLTRMLSGPLATRILADFGAEVIKVQSAGTAQGAERNDTAHFNVWNRNKRGICLDLNRAAGREILLRLVSISDVVVENFSPRVMDNWGLTYDRLREAKPDILAVSITAAGSRGPWRDFVGFAPTFHALSGLLAAMSPARGIPVNLGHSYGDVVAGLYAAVAILAALQHRDSTGEGQHIDLSAYEAVCTLLGPEYMKCALERIRQAGKRAPSGNSFEGCYRCAGGDRWCVISIRSDRQWEAFRRVLKEPALMSHKFFTPAGRRVHHAELNELIGRWTVRHAARAVIRRLQRAGIAAAVVQDAEDLAKDRHLKARRFFVAVKHPMLGTVVSDRSALWPWNRSTIGWKAAPLLGEDNRYVFVDLLGMSDAEVRSLNELEIIR